MRPYLLAILIAASWSDALAQASPPPSSMPKCSGEKSTWSDCIGTLTTADGIEYVGEFANDRPNGVGAVKGPSYQYVGEFLDGKFDGHGVFTLPDEKYVGGFKSGLRHGEGRQMYPAGASYVGQWKNGKRDGFGDYDYGNGNIASGVWLDDKPVQPEKWSTLQRMAWGGYRPGKTDYRKLPVVIRSTLPPCPATEKTPWSNCIGEKYFTDGDLPGVRSKYIGEFKNNTFDGQGHFIWANGKQYVGQWRNGQPHGAGTLLEPNTAFHIGEWRYGKRNGRGEYWPTRENDACVAGVWEDDILVFNAAPVPFVNDKNPVSGCIKNTWVDDSEGWVGLKK